MKTRVHTCTNDGITKSQPGICVSTRTINGVVVLNVYRNYDIKNSYGGVGVSKPLDAYGMIFHSEEDAWAYALVHGYLREYFTLPSIRARRKALANRPANSFIQKEQS